LVLRFFAFLEKYQAFDHSVKDFLNDYMREAASKPISNSQEAIFKRTFALLKSSLSSAIVRGNRGVTQVNLFEGIAVGTALALKSGKTVHKARLPALLNDTTLRSVTTGATNTRKAVTGRIEYVRDKLIK
jgi:hypothetical protein